MQIREFTPDDTATIQAVVELLNASGKVDAPFAHPQTVSGYTGQLRHGWDGEPPRGYAAWEADRLAGVVEISTSEWDNTHLGWVSFVVHPDLRRQGRGSELFGFARDRVRALGRTSLGCDAWDNATTRGFADRHGLPAKGAAINRRQTLAGLDRGALEEAYDEAAAAARDYELVRLHGRTPDELIGAVADVTGAINDAPTDDLDIEDEVFPVQRIIDYESAQLARGHRFYRLLARHRASGELAGQSVLAVESERPWIGDQHDTSVVRAHRGHRLGLLLKADMLRWLGEVEPGLETIDTWNAESNRHMIAVNERLGYQVLAREIQFQIDV